MPTISVIVPVYNVEKYLARCLDSILNQTFTDFEVICVNDGSKDGCAAILEEYAHKDGRIIVISQENQGLSMARNNGLKRAQGEYISFIDSDDAIEKQCLEIAYTLIAKHQADMVCWNFARSDGYEIPQKHFDIESLQTKITNNPLSLYYNPSNDCYYTKHNVCDKLFRHSMIQSISFPEGLYYEDAAYFWQVILKHPKTVITSTPLYLYTANQNSIMREVISIKHIKDYQNITNLIHSHIKDIVSQEELSIFKTITINSFIDVQLHRLTENIIVNPLPLWIALEEQLHDLDAKGILPTYDETKKEHRAYKYILQHGATRYFQTLIPSLLEKAYRVICLTPIPNQRPLWLDLGEQIRTLATQNLLPEDFTKNKKYHIYNILLKHGGKEYYEKEVLAWNKKLFHIQETKTTKTCYSFGLPFYSKETTRTKKSIVLFGIKIFSKEKLSAKQRVVHILGIPFSYISKKSH